MYQCPDIYTYVQSKLISIVDPLRQALEQARNFNRYFFWPWFLSFLLLLVWLFTNNNIKASYLNLYITYEFRDIFRFNIAKGYYWEFKDSNGEIVKKVSHYMPITFSSTQFFTQYSR